MWNFCGVVMVLLYCTNKMLLLQFVNCTALQIYFNYLYLVFGLDNIVLGFKMVFLTLQK